MMNRLTTRLRSALRYGTILAALVIVMVDWATAADLQKSSSGRLRINQADKRDDPRLEIELGSGMMASGDLFQLKSDVMRLWETPKGEMFAATRFNVTLDENALIHVGLKYRISRSLGLRLNYERVEMDAILQSYTISTVEQRIFDTLTINNVGLDLVYELATAKFRPYLLAGASLAQMSGTAEVYSSEFAGIRYGAGISYQVARFTRAVVEVAATRIDIDSEGVMGDTLFADSQFETLGPQQLFGLKAFVTIGI